MNPTVGEELNCVRETTSCEDPYAVAAMHNCTVVDHVPRKMRPYALRELCAWVLRITSCFIIGDGGCFAIRQTAKLKSSPNFPAIRYLGHELGHSVGISISQILHCIVITFDLLL